MEIEWTPNQIAGDPSSSGRHNLHNAYRSGRADHVLLPAALLPGNCLDQVRVDSVGDRRLVQDRADITRRRRRRRCRCSWRAAHSWNDQLLSDIDEVFVRYAGPICLNELSNGNSVSRGYPPEGISWLNRVRA